MVSSPRPGTSAEYSMGHQLCCVVTGVSSSSKLPAKRGASAASAGFPAARYEDAYAVEDGGKVSAARDEAGITLRHVAASAMLPKKTRISGRLRAVTPRSRAGTRFDVAGDVDGSRAVVADGARPQNVKYSDQRCTRSSVSAWGTLA